MPVKQLPCCAVQGCAAQKANTCILIGVQVSEQFRENVVAVMYIKPGQKTGNALPAFAQQFV